MTKWKQYTR